MVRDSDSKAVPYAHCRSDVACRGSLRHLCNPSNHNYPHKHTCASKSMAVASYFRHYMMFLARPSSRYGSHTDEAKITFGVGASHIIKI